MPSRHKQRNDHLWVNFPQKEPIGASSEQGSIPPVLLQRAIFIAQTGSAKLTLVERIGSLSKADGLQMSLASSQSSNVLCITSRFTRETDDVQFHLRRVIMPNILTLF